MPTDPPAPPVTTGDEVRTTRLPGDRVGPYKLLALIGEGGMGEVWAADQAEPVRRRVALKLIKPGMDSRQVLARFEAERQALALMDHPNIAKVLDAGTAPEGRPFFAMELVKGLPLTKFCDEKKLTPRQRLELFIPVCQAVQHAHQKGVIHRDLKPSNVLVEEVDGRPVPKVIDFGVAKAVAHPLTDLTLYTGLGAVVGTPAYMAPEQAGANAADVDTRADIYALGVILYELLAGSPPFDPARLKKAALDEVIRVIREEDPPKPSTRLSTADALPSIAAQRGTDPARLVRLLRGDVEWVVMKCLEKDRNRRYDTANGLAMDLQRYLADEPVAAGPPSVGYRVRKFARRNRGPVVAGCLLLAALVAGIAGTTGGLLWALGAEKQARAEAEAKDKALAAEEAQRQEADRRRAEAETQRDRALAARTRTREALDMMTSEATEDALARQASLTPEQRAFFEKVLPYYEEFAAEPGEDRAARQRVATAHARMASMLMRLGSEPRALTVAGRAAELFDRLAADPEATPEDRAALARTVLLQGDLAFRNTNVLSGVMGGARLLARAEDLFARAAAERPADPSLREGQGYAATRLGYALWRASRPQQALAPLRRGVRVFEGLVAEFPDRPLYRGQLSHSLNELALRAPATAEWEAEGLRLIDQSFALCRQALAQAPSDPRLRRRLMWTHVTKAYFLVTRRVTPARTGPGLSYPFDQQLLRQTARGPDAPREIEEAFREALTEAERIVAMMPADRLAAFERGLLVHTHAVYLDNYLKDDAGALVAYSRAVDYLRPGLPVGSDSGNVDRDELVETLRGRANLFGLLGRHREAAADWAELAELRRAVPEGLWARRNYGQALARAGEVAAAVAEAEAVFRAELEKMPGPFYHANGAAVLAVVARLTSDPASADRHAARAVELLRQGVENGRALSAGNLGMKDFDSLRTRADFREHFGSPGALVRLHEQAAERLTAQGRHDQAYRLLLHGAIPNADPAQAASLFRAAEELKRRLTDQSPANPVYEVALADSYRAFGLRLRGQGKLAESVAWFDKAIATLQPVHAKDPDADAPRRSLLTAYEGRALAHHQLGRQAESLKDLDQVMALCTAEEQPACRAYRANVRVLAGMVGEAVADVADLTRSEDWSASQWYGFACVYAVASGKLPEKRQAYAERALELLTKATGAGWNNPAHAAKDTDLDPLRDRDDFKKWLASMPGPKPQPREGTKAMNPDK